MFIPAGSGERTREHLDEYRRFRQLTQRLLAISEEICESPVREAKPENEKISTWKRWKRRFGDRRLRLAAQTVEQRIK